MRHGMHRSLLIGMVSLMPETIFGQSRDDRAGPAWHFTSMASAPDARVPEDARADRSEPQSAEAVGLFGLPAAPLTGPLVTDRPDFTESTDAVESGHTQLEMGYTFTFDHEDGVRGREHTAPELLLRVGLIEDVELRLGWDGYTYTRSREEVRIREGGVTRTVVEEGWEQGAEDLAVGFKLKLVEQDGWVPHFGVIAAMRVPSGSANRSGGDVDPEVILLWAYDVTERFSVAGNVGLAVPSTEPGDRFFQTSASLSLAYAITDEIGGYVEYFGFYPNEHHTDAAHNLNGGFTYLITDNVQLDWRIGMGLNDEAPDFFTGVGMSFRF